MPHLALYTFGFLREPWGHPSVAGFEQRLQPIFDLSWSMPGFIDGLREPVIDNRFMPWGLPRCVRDDQLDRVSITVSRWDAIESAFAFSYSWLHAEALRHRREWAEPIDWPPYCLWWLAEDAPLTYNDAALRLTHLHDQGSSAESFSFREPFDSLGNRCDLDKRLISTIRERRVEIPAHD